VALLPDLYHGELAHHDEMDKAAHLMQSLPADRAARDMSGAVDFLAGNSAVTGDGIGVVGFCMGGMLALLLAVNRADKVKAAVTFYGFPSGDGEPDWSGLDASVRGHMAENDDFFGPTAAKGLEDKLRGMGKDVVFTVHPGTGHAFMGPHNALGTLNEELQQQLWPQTVAFLHEKLG
jgi:carboxymethylenebutenolidase